MVLSSYAADPRVSSLVSFSAVGLALCFASSSSHFNFVFFWGGVLWEMATAVTLCAMKELPPHSLFFPEPYLALPISSLELNEARETIDRDIANLMAGKSEFVQESERLRIVRTNNLIQKLQKNWDEKNAENEVDSEEEGAGKEKHAEIVMALNTTLGRKDLTSSAKITEEEEKMIHDRVQMQQKHYEEYQQREKERKVIHIRRCHPHVTDLEAGQALSHCEDDENEAVAQLWDTEFLKQMRMLIVTSHICESDEEHYQGDKKTKKINVKRLPLDDALKRTDKMEGWSEARIRAYQLIDTNPNAYYYRFNAPGEVQRNGKWSGEEKQLFLKRMKEFGVNGKWGLFAMGIPGRVGYQCSNFYRNLIEEGEVTDANYIIDANGKAHYIFAGGKSNRHPKLPKPKPIKAKKEDPSDEGETGKKKKRGKKRKRKSKGWSTEDDEDEVEELDADDGEYRPSFSKRKQEIIAQREAELAEANPLPGFVDPITLDEVLQPALSPYGHVMDRATWHRALSQEPRNICPFTKNKLHFRDLVILTKENIDDYRDKIVNLNA